jgi:hypothetical protein
VKVVRVLMNPIGVANRVRWMKPAVAIFGRLHNMRKNFHWHMTGRHFPDYHLYNVVDDDRSPVSRQDFRNWLTTIPPLIRMKRREPNRYAISSRF